MQKELKVLILEDHATVAELVVLTLRKAGFVVGSHLVETPDAFTAALDRQAWDVIVSDHSMPAFTGLDALRLLRTRDQKTPFIMMTANPYPELEAAVNDGGGQAFLDKCDLFELPGHIIRLCTEFHCC